MKSRHVSSLLVAIALFAATLTAHTQTWDAEDALLPGPGFAPEGDGYAVLINPFTSFPAPGVFVGYNTSGYGGPSILRLTPNDASSSSFTVEAVDHGLTMVTRLANNDGDALYAAGSAPIDPKARNATHVWKVRKSAAQGDPGNWVNEDTFVLAKNAPSTAYGITTDSLGNVFVSGVARDSKAPHWIVRRKTPGDIFRTVFDAKGDNGNMIPTVCFFPGNATNPNPAVLTVSDLNSKWTVMRSQSQGASGTWQQVDS
jgi:hypothetical protein